MELQQLVKELGSAIEPVRDAAFERVTPLLRDGAVETEIDARKLWKGLFYGLWNLDGVEEQLKRANAISMNLTAEGVSPEAGEMLWTAFLATLRQEWILIDQYRLDKYYALARAMLHGLFVRALNQRWSRVEPFVTLEAEILSSPAVAPGLPLHFVEIYIDELNRARVVESAPSLSQRAYLCLLYPFVKTLRTPLPSKTKLKNRIQELVVAELRKEVAGTDSEIDLNTVLRQFGLEAVTKSSTCVRELNAEAAEAKAKLPEVVEPARNAEKRRGATPAASGTPKRRRRRKR